MRKSNEIISRRGFSLVELVVSVAIVALLAGISIPAYNRHKKKAMAADSFLTANSIIKAIRSCVSGAPFDVCDDVNSLGLSSIEGLAVKAQNNPNICFQFERASAGRTYKSCVSVNTSTLRHARKHLIYAGSKVSRGFCHYTGPKSCASCGCAAGASSGYCKVLNIECSSDSDCPNPPSHKTSASKRTCITGAMGACNTATAVCE